MLINKRKGMIVQGVNQNWEQTLLSMVRKPGLFLGDEHPRLPCR